MTYEDEKIELEAFKLFAATKMYILGRQLVAPLSYAALIELWHRHSERIRERYRQEARGEQAA